MYYLTVDIYEILQNGPKKTLSHTFYGSSAKEAQAIFQAHMKNDSFLKNMVESGKFQNLKGTVSYSQGRTLF